MRIFPAFLTLLSLILWSSCRSDFELTESTGQLKFSRDTVFLDTVFKNTSSATYTLKVFNPSNEDLFIPKIELGKGETSAYRLNLDGLPGKSFENIEILAKDSLYIFVETTVNLQEESGKNYLYRDVIRFRSKSHLQEVPLITLVKDAVFLYPKKDEQGVVETIPLGMDELGNQVKVQGFFLQDDQLNFTSEKAYVIYGYAAVPAGKTLNIEAGSRIYFHTNSGLLITNHANLKVNGNRSNTEGLEEEVIFQGDKLTSEFTDVAGQWGAIWIQKGSSNNFITHTTIRNAGIGILAEGETITESVTLYIKNTQIYNSAVNGIRGIGGNIQAENLVINNSGQASLHLTGGNYVFKHSTIANYYNQGFRSYPAVLLENEIQSGSTTRTLDLEKATFSNSIIYGNEKIELLFNENKNAAFTYKFINCLIRFEDDRGTYAGNPNYNFLNKDHYHDLIINKDPFFWNPGNNDLRLQANSPAIDSGNVSTANEVPRDILYISRIPNPDLGAYEWKTLEE